MIKKIKKGNKAFLFSDEEICNNFDISIDYYRIIFQYLSQYTHPLPFGVKQMMQLSNSIDEIFTILNPDLDYCITFCHLMIHYFLTEVDISKYNLPDHMKADMDKSMFFSSNYSKITFDH